MIFCTLFNWLYLPQGIALYRSLQRVCRNDFVLYVLCIDDFTAAVLRELKLHNARVVMLGDLDDEELEAVRANRTLGEFCWTCTTPLLLYVLRRQQPRTIVVYVDADLYFYSDPSVVLKEMADGSIYIHEHDFAPEFAHLQPIAGRFNVGLAAFRNNSEAIACLQRWRAQCINECVMNPSAGKCGDQNYLDEWPKLYPGLVIAKDPGIGLAPWNISKHRLVSRFGQIKVKGRPVVFYHFHSLRLLQPKTGSKPVVMAADEAYTLSDETVVTIYQPYAGELWRALRLINKTKEVKALAHGFLAEFPKLPRWYIFV